MLLNINESVFFSFNTQPNWSHHTIVINSLLFRDTHTKKQNRKEEIYTWKINYLDWFSSLISRVHIRVATTCWLISSTTCSLWRFCDSHQLSSGCCCPAPDAMLLPGPEGWVMTGSLLFLWTSCGLFPVKGNGNQALQWERHFWDSHAIK